MFGSIGFPEIIVILVLATLLFGPKKIPELGRTIGKGLREFKKSTSGIMDSLNADINEPVKQAQPQPQAQQAAAQPAAKPAPAPTPPPAESEPVKRTATVIDLEKDGND